MAELVDTRNLHSWPRRVQTRIIGIGSMSAHSKFGIALMMAHYDYPNGRWLQTKQNVLGKPPQVNSKQANWRGMGALGICSD
jgi:hypothetical protein